MGRFPGKEKNMKKIVMEGLHCANCSKRVEKALAKIGGKKLTVSHVDGIAQGEFKPTVTDEAIKEAIEALGFVVKGIE